MEFTAEMIASYLGGTVVGDPQTTVSTFAKKRATPVRSPSWPTPSTSTTFTIPSRPS